MGSQSLNPLGLRASISDSIFAQIATTGAPSFAAYSRTRSSGGLFSKPCSSTFAT